MMTEEEQTERIAAAKRRRTVRVFLIGIPVVLAVCALNVVASHLGWNWIEVLTKSAIVTVNIGFAHYSLRTYFRGRRSEHWQYAYYRRAVNLSLIAFAANAFVALMTLTDWSLLL